MMSRHSDATILPPEERLPEPRCPLLIGIKHNIADGLTFMPKQIQDRPGDNKIKWGVYGTALVKVPMGVTNVQILPIVNGNDGSVNGYCVTFNLATGMAKSIKVHDSWIGRETDRWDRRLEVYMYVTEVETVTP